MLTFKTPSQECSCSFKKYYVCLKYSYFPSKNGKVAVLRRCICSFGNYWQNHWKKIISRIANLFPMFIDFPSFTAMIFRLFCAFRLLFVMFNCFCDIGTMSYSIINLVNRQYKSITGNTLILLLMLRQTKRETRI